MVRVNQSFASLRFYSPIHPIYFSILIRFKKIIVHLLFRNKFKLFVKVVQRFFSYLVRSFISPHVLAPLQIVSVFFSASIFFFFLLL